MYRKAKTQKEKILQVVEQIRDGDKTVYQCAVDIDCAEKCFYSQSKTFIAGNFKRHFQSHHPHVLKELALEKCSADEDEPGQKKSKACKPKLAVEMEKRDGKLCKMVIEGLLKFYATLEKASCNPISCIRWEGEVIPINMR